MLWNRGPENGRLSLPPADGWRNTGNE